jgi:hypothetical protein
LDFKKNKKNEGIYYNSFICEKNKIMSINIPTTDLVAVGIFSKEMKSGLIRLFLLNMIISYINYQGDKKDYFKSQDFKNIKSIDKINFSNFNNYMYSKIYDTFLSIPLQIHLWKNVQRIFKKRTLYIKDILYKNYYLIDIKKRKLILNGKSLQNNINSNIGDCDINIPRNKKIWKELIFYCKNLKKDYIKKNDTNFNINDYKNFFVKIEYKSTYPRRTFIIQFLPLLNGMCIIHEYIQLTLDEDETNKKYKERNIMYGYDSTDKIFRNTSTNFFENENDILKQIHFFIIESLFCSNFSINNFFYLDKREKIYFSEEILDIIKEELFEFIENNKKIYSNLTSSNHSFYSNKITKQLLNILYEEFIQINNKEKVLHKSSSALPLNSMKSILSIKSISAKKVENFLLQITKEEALTYLFNSIKFNKNINPNDITIDLNDENGKRDSISRISDLIERNSGPNIRFSDLLSEKTIKPKITKIKNKFVNNNNINNINNVPFPPDSDDNDFKSNGGYSYNIIKKTIKQKKNLKLKKNIANKNIKNKINNSGDNSLQRCLIDEIIPNINNENGKIKVSNQKLLK